MRDSTPLVPGTQSTGLAFVVFLLILSLAATLLLVRRGPDERQCARGGRSLLVALVYVLALVLLLGGAPNPWEITDDRPAADQR